MEILTTEFVQTLILMIPNFAGFLILTSVLWMNNNRLLTLLEQQLKECSDRRDREEILMVRQPPPPLAPDQANSSRAQRPTTGATGRPSTRVTNGPSTSSNP